MMFRKAVYLVFITTFFMVQYASLQSINPLEPKFEYVDCGCAGTISVNIYNGLYPPYGGDLVTDKINIGAVTIANLNDTDGDDPTNSNTSKDKDDPNVQGFLFGRNEVDLMKFVINIDGVLPTQCNKFVKIDLNGPLRLWNTSHKQIEELRREFQVEELPITLYIEATDHSTLVRDMSIKTFFGNDLIDEAKITSIWCDLINTYCDRSNTLIPQNLDKISVIDYITNAESYYDLSKTGFGSNTKKNSYDDDFGGRYILEIAHNPRNLENLDITFDLTQRVEIRDKMLPTGQSNFVFSNKNFPEQVELPNDASHNFNDDSEPKNSFMYYWDAPGLRGIHSLSGINSFSQRDVNLQTFCRLSINNKNAFEFGKVNLQSILSSRCSNYAFWQLKFLLKSDNDDDILYPNEYDDPYNSNYHKYKMVDKVLDHSFPIRNSLTSGNGIINIILDNNTPTAGYALKFQSNVWYLIEDLTNTIAASTFINGKWNIQALGRLTIEISNGNIQFNEGAELFFNVINEPINNYLICH